MTEETKTSTDRRALVVVDVLRDFLPGGALAVPGGDEILPVINRLLESGRYARKILVHECHPPGHVSFASRHGREPFQTIELEGGRRQALWPDHCVKGTGGADYPEELRTDLADTEFFKGTEPDVENYSGFEDEDGEDTGLTEDLRSHGLGAIDIVGLALDVCVAETARDAVNPPRSLGTRIVSEGTRGIAGEEELADTVAELRGKGIRFVDLEEALVR